jgi:hypothetical protein
VPSIAPQLPGADDVEHGEYAGSLPVRPERSRSATSPADDDVNAALASALEPQAATVKVG